LRGDTPPTTLYVNVNESDARYRLSKRWTIKHLLGISIGLLIAIYSFYAIRLGDQTQDILQQLSKLLR
ncbi:DotU family type IV/VI secretion system protein, partial [Xenorhabdus bovienii]|nr:DotU family type IV/VI secretion system protein [Xenorhabdus bovienii]